MQVAIKTIVLKPYKRAAAIKPELALSDLTKSYRAIIINKPIASNNIGARYKHLIFVKRNRMICMKAIGYIISFNWE